MSLSEGVFAQEFHPSGVQSYVRRKDGSIGIISTDTNTSLLSSSIVSSIKSVFLPAGYPESVSTDYIEYQIWDSLQAFFSSLSHTLATHSVLKGAGVGDANATPLAATITWLLKDGTGMLGSILFAYSRGSSLDSECKKWRIFADFVNDVSFCIDLCSHHFSSLFLPIQCFSGLMRSLVGVAGGATRAALTQHQARRNNLADVSAKDGSQETLVNLIALIVNLVVVPMVVNNSTVVWTLFMLLTFLHLFCNYKAVRAVNMEIFNTSRLTSTVIKFLQNGEILTPREANRIENVWFFIPEACNFKLGVCLSHHQNLHQLCEQKRQKYFLSSSSGQALVSNHRNSSHLDILESAFRAIAVMENPNLINHTKDINDKFKMFVSKCSKVGWSFEKQLLTCDEYRYDCI